VIQFLAAMRANIIDLKIGAKHPACAAGGANAAHAFADGLPRVSGGAAAILLVAYVGERCQDRGLPTTEVAHMQGIIC
jgi:hypothetical protein